MVHIRLLTFVFLSLCPLSWAVDYGDMPVDRMPPNGWQDVTWQNPGNWTVINVGKHGVVPNNPRVDAAEKVEAIIRQGSGNRVIYFPAGTYTFKSTCDITTGGIILRGAGKDQTTINIQCKADGILFQGAYSAPELRISGAVVPGDNQVIVNDAAGLQLGDFIQIYHPSLMSLYWGKKTGPTGEYGQIVRITEKKGNILGIDMKLGLEIPGDEPPRAKNVDLIHDVGVEDLKVYRVSLGEKDQGQIRNIVYENVFNGYLRRVESDHSYGWHIAVVGSRNVVLSENYIHDGWATGGGRAYGINMRMTSTQCLAVNNVLEKCRHHLNFGRGTNHCIFAYNKCDGRLSHDNYILFHGSHNNHNLVEGNWATGNIVIDGWHHQEGKNNWYFRNFTTTEVGDRARHVKSPRTCIVGNECQDITYPADMDCYVGANKVNKNMQWGELKENSRIPASLYLSTKPDFVEKWPLYGPPMNMADSPQTSKRKQPHGQAKKPNVLTFIIDDAGWKDVGYNGGEIATPMIDRLAGTGIRLNKFYAYSTCTPTRAAFFTGKAPSRSSIVYPIQHDDRYGLPPEMETLPEVFRRNGYRTALIGKWHLGVQPEFAPNAHGFDYHYGILGGWTDQFTRENPKIGYDWVRNNKPVEKEEGHTTDLLTADALRYIHEADDAPFFLCVSYTAPHVPIQVDPKWSEPYEGRFATKTRQGYAGMMAQLDDSIGRIIQALEKQGLLETTLVVFFSDNGPSAPGKKWYIPEDFHKINFYGNNGQYGDVGPLRGWKASPYDGGVRVPAFLYWKGRLSGSNWETPVIVEDLYRTILGLVKLDVSAAHPPEGRNIFAPAHNQHATFYWRTPNNLALLEDGWKLILKNGSPFDPNLKPELYHVGEDISEGVDCVKTHPEKLARLLELMKVAFKKDPEPHVNPALLDK